VLIGGELALDDLAKRNAEKKWSSKLMKSRRNMEEKRLALRREGEFSQWIGKGKVKFEDGANDFCCWIRL
jgi:hypothetical protein